MRDGTKRSVTLAVAADHLRPRRGGRRMWMREAAAGDDH
jgi:hypothetical protein